VTFYRQNIPETEILGDKKLAGWTFEVYPQKGYLQSLIDSKNLADQQRAIDIVYAATAPTDDASRLIQAMYRSDVHRLAYFDPQSKQLKIVDVDPKQITQEQRREIFERNALLYGSEVAKKGINGAPLKAGEYWSAFIANPARGAADPFIMVDDASRAAYAKRLLQKGAPASEVQKYATPNSIILNNALAAEAKHGPGAGDVYIGQALENVGVNMLTANLPEIVSAGREWRDTGDPSRVMGTYTAAYLAVSGVVAAEYLRPVESSLARETSPFIQRNLRADPCETQLGQFLHGEAQQGRLRGIRAVEGAPESRVPGVQSGDYRFTLENGDVISADRYAAKSGRLDNIAANALEKADQAQVVVIEFGEEKTANFGKVEAQTVADSILDTSQRIRRVIVVKSKEILVDATRPGGPGAAR
jgi:hypothetical protein